MQAQHGATFHCKQHWQLLVVPRVQNVAALKPASKKAQHDAEGMPLLKQLKDQMFVETKRKQFFFASNTQCHTVRFYERRGKTGGAHDSIRVQRRLPCEGHASCHVCVGEEHFQRWSLEVAALRAELTSWVATRISPKQLVCTGGSPMVCTTKMATERVRSPIM